MILVSLACCSTFANQLQPDKKRVVQIQQALLDHKFGSHAANGNWDDATRSTLKQIAADNGWQTSHVPDARVLILIGLGNPHSDMDVTTQHRNHLDHPND
jgi:hypothetical protein